MCLLYTEQFYLLLDCDYNCDYKLNLQMKTHPTHSETDRIKELGTLLA